MEAPNNDYTDIIDDEGNVINEETGDPITFEMPEDIDNIAIELDVEESLDIEDITKKATDEESEVQNEMMDVYHLLSHLDESLTSGTLNGSEVRDLNAKVGNLSSKAKLLTSRGVDVRNDELYTELVKLIDGKFADEFKVLESKTKEDLQVITDTSDDLDRELTPKIEALRERLCGIDLTYPAPKGEASVDIFNTPIEEVLDFLKVNYEVPTGLEALFDRLFALGYKGKDISTIIKLIEVNYNDWLEKTEDLKGKLSLFKDTYTNKDKYELILFSTRLEVLAIVVKNVNDLFCEMDVINQMESILLHKL